MGDVQSLIKGFQSLAQKENLRRMKEKRREEFTPPGHIPHTTLPANEEPPPNNNQNPPDNPTTQSDEEEEDTTLGTIETLSPEQIEWLKDTEATLLVCSPFSSGPPPVKKAIPSALGLVDVHCRRLTEHFRKIWTPRTKKSELNNIIKAYTIYHKYRK